MSEIKIKLTPYSVIVKFSVSLSVKIGIIQFIAMGQLSWQSTNKWGYFTKILYFCNGEIWKDNFIVWNSETISFDFTKKSL